MSSTDLICQYHTLLPIASIGGRLNYNIMQQFGTKNNYMLKLHPIFETFWLHTNSIPVYNILHVTKILS